MRSFKKSFPFSLFVIGFLTLSMTFFSLADSTIEIAPDDSFAWSYSVGEKGLTTYEEDLTIPDEYVIEGDIEGIKVKIREIGGITEENGIEFSEIEVDYYKTTNKAEDAWNLDDGKDIIKVYTYDKDYYSSGDFLLKLIYGAIIFIPTDVDWDEAVELINISLANDNTVEDFDIDSLDNGLELDLTYIDVKEIKLEVYFNELGVLSSYILEYDDELVYEKTLDDPALAKWHMMFMIITIIITLSAVSVIIYKMSILFKEGVPPLKRHQTKFRCVSVLENNAIPKSILSFISRQKTNSGIIRRESLSEGMKEEGIDFARYEIIISHYEVMPVSVSAQIGALANADKQNPGLIRNKILKELRKDRSGLLGYLVLRVGLYRKVVDEDEKYQMKDFSSKHTIEKEFEEITFELYEDFTKEIKALLNFQRLKEINNSTPSSRMLMEVLSLIEDKPIFGLAASNCLSPPYDGFTIYAKIGQYAPEERKRLFTTFMRGEEDDCFIISEKNNITTEVYWVTKKHSNDRQGGSKETFNLIAKQKGTPLNLHRFFEQIRVMKNKSKSLEPDF